MICKQCGSEISDDSIFCMMCGCKIPEKKRANKKMIVILVLFFLIICGVGIILILGGSGNPAKQAIKIIEDDYGKKVNITAVYYNEEENGCIVEFTSGGIEDEACVHLDDKTVGYVSVYEELTDKMQDESLSREEQQKYAKEIVNYPYDVFWVYNLVMHGPEASDWEKIQ